METPALFGGLHSIEVIDPEGRSHLLTDGALALVGRMGGCSGGGVVHTVLCVCSAKVD